MHSQYLLTLSIALFSITCFGQVSFKKGYFIDDQGNRTDCFIRDVDWKNSPTTFDYRLTESAETQKRKTETVKEFAVADTKYVRTKTRYDQTSQDIKSLGITSNPDWVEADLLLKVIVDGKASLYHYSTRTYSLFFFSVDESPIEQLVFRNYFNQGDATQLAANKLYLGQLNGRVNCGNELASDNQVPYQLKPLANFFKQYNTCSGEVAQETSDEAKSFSLRLTPGVDFANVTADAVNNRTYVFPSATTFRLGVEIQLTLPFNHGKWAIIAEPTYQSFKGTASTSPSNHSTLSYQTIEFPFGVRHRFFLSDKSNIFVNGMVLLDFPIKHVQTIQQGIFISDEAPTTRGTFGLAAGAGYSFGRFSVEGRYYPERKRAQESIATVYYTKSSVILGFRLTK